MLGKETFVLKRSFKVNPDLLISWAFPNGYEIGMTSLGYQIVWRQLDKTPYALVKRVFTDCQEDGWQDADLLGFTLSWELDSINVLRLIKQAGLPLLSCERDAGCPLVFGGGPCLAANPEPYAPFFDVILLGDAESVVPAFLNAWSQARLLGDRTEQLLALSQVEGIYVPSAYRYNLSNPKGPLLSVEPVHSRVPQQIHKSLFLSPANYAAHSQILSGDTTWANMFLIEIARSCPQECRFCLASYLTRPFRAASIATIINKIDLGLKYTNKIGLLGPSVTEHPQFDQLAEELIKRPEIQISIASVRADSLNPLICRMLHKLGQRTLTMAIESGSERLRSIMKKNLTRDQIFQAIALASESGFAGVKLYGIVGLPGETCDDLDETIALLGALKKEYKRLRLVFSCSSFVPKAQTPFQWAGRDAGSAEKLQYLRKHLGKTGIAMRPESHNWSDIQALLSRGDRRLAPVLAAVAESQGNLGSWRDALRRLPATCPDLKYYVFRHIPYEETLPWSHLMEPAREKMLVGHSQKADAYA